MHNQKYKILIFAPDCYPPISPEAIVTSKLIIAMKNIGWIVHVISAKVASGYPFEEDEFWQDVKENTERIYAPDEKNIKNVTQRLLTACKTGHITDGLAWTREAIILGEKLIKKEKYDVILSRAYPEYAHHPALYLAQQYHIPWIANWNDPVPLSKFLPPRGHGLDGEIKTYTKRLLNTVARKANCHTFPSERLRVYMSKYLPFNDRNKSFVIPHVSLKALSFTNIHQHNDKFTLCHAGGLNPKSDRDPFTFFKGVKIFCDKIKNRNLIIKFIGGENTELKLMVDNMGINDVISMTNYKKYMETLEILALADVLVCIEEAAEEGIYLPSKFVDYVQINRPILAISPQSGTLSDIIAKYGGGIAVNCEMPERIAEALEQLYLCWKNETLTKDYNLQILQTIFSEKKIIEQYNELFEQVISNRTK